MFCIGFCWHSSYAVGNDSPIDSVTMLVPNVWSMPGDTINLPVLMLDDVTGSAIFSVTLDFVFDPDVITLAGDSVVMEGTISDDWLPLFVYNQIDSTTLRMVWASADSLKGNGPFVFIVLRIYPTASIGETSVLSLKVCSINEGYPACRAFDGILTVGESPKIEISESTFDFGTVTIGQSNDWTLHISNVGNNVLDVYRLASDSTQFELISPSFPQSISASQVVDAVIAFKPTYEDTVKGNLRLFSNDLDNLIIDIPLQGTGRGTSVQLSSFSAQRQGKDVILKWVALEEIAHLGYYLYRSCHSDRNFQRIHAELITGYSKYTFCDKTADGSNLYYYMLNAIDNSGYEETVGFTVIKGLQSIPTDYSLSQNYPNPFNPVTYITFGIPEKEFVTLIIYNALGQEVRTLCSEVAESGFYSVSWNGSDEMGNTLPSGIYFYRLQTSNVRISKRMLLLR